MLHSDNLNIPKNRDFGFFWSTIFLLAGIYTFYFHGAIWGVGFLLLCIFTFTISVFKEGYLQPLNKAWMRLGLILGKVISPIVLGIIFFGIFFPVGITIRLSGRDELHLRLRREKSHWINRTSDSTNVSSFNNQY
jgi:hypothetical protein